MLSNSPFETPQSPKLKVPEDAEVVFVSDMFVEDYVGGAELTSEAIISSSPLKVFKLHSRDVSIETLEQGHKKYWIFGNFSALNMDLIPSIVSNMNYSILEYDYKFCRYRSPEKHELETGSPCDCIEDIHGKMISAFYYGSKSLWWMSEKQMDLYLEAYPFLSERENTVLSSVFDDAFFYSVKILREKYKDQEKTGWLVLGSSSWIKGADQAEQWCKDNEKEYEVVWNLEYEELLERLAKSEGFVYLPKGNDTCPRMVIEAKLLGCKLHLNDYVQHKDEEWFSSESIRDTVEWLMSGPSRFWTEINREINKQPTISGYTTTLNCIDQKYPFEASINSMLGFCDQVVIVDGGSTDGTVETLNKMSENDSRIIVHIQERDWDSKRFAVFDGLQKALGRAMCTSDFCWQQDSDEVVHENDYGKVKDLVKRLPKSMDLIALPVLEFWGSDGKIRIDINPWKWRVSRNRPHITHGIPASLRQIDKNGDLYSKPGSDGCDYIRSDTYEPIPFVNFYTQEAQAARELALKGDQDAIEAYTQWIQHTTTSLPSVIHYSWYDIERKIKTYKNYWSKHWQSLYDIRQEDIAENNMFFDKPWEEVTDRDIKEMSEKLSSKMGGWIFHSKVDFDKPTPWITVNDSIHPEVIKEWLK